MSIDQREVGQILGIARKLVQLIDAGTITIAQVNAGGGPPMTRAQMATLINRAYAETGNVGTPPAL